MKSWDDLSAENKTWMEFLGDFGPTANAHSREVKGFMHDNEGGGKVYLSSDELRLLSSACIAVADWLDMRAKELQKEVDFAQKTEQSAQLATQPENTENA